VEVVSDRVASRRVHFTLVTLITVACDREHCYDKKSPVSILSFSDRRIDIASYTYYRSSRVASRYVSLLLLLYDKKPNSIALSSSLAGRDQISLHYPARDQLMSRSATSSRAGSRAASELDEDLRVHVVCVSQAKFHYAIQLANTSQAGLQPARKLEADLLASKIA